MYQAARLFPLDVRRRVARRYGPFVAANPGTTPACAEGYCVMGVLLRETTDVNMHFPGPSQVVDALDQCGGLPAGLDHEEARRLVDVAMIANDKGKLATREAVCRFLGVRP
jgi:hypothetical protein